MREIQLSIINEVGSADEPLSRHHQLVQLSLEFLIYSFPPFVTCSIFMANGTELAD